MSSVNPTNTFNEVRKASVVASEAKSARKMTLDLPEKGSIAERVLNVKNLFNQASDRVGNAVTIPPSITGRVIVGFGVAVAAIVSTGVVVAVSPVVLVAALVALVGYAIFLCAKNFVLFCKDPKAAIKAINEALQAFYKNRIVPITDAIHAAACRVEKSILTGWFAFTGGSSKEDKAKMMEMIKALNLKVSILDRQVTNLKAPAQEALQEACDAADAVKSEKDKDKAYLDGIMQSLAADTAKQKAELDAIMDEFVDCLPTAEVEAPKPALEAPARSVLHRALPAVGAVAATLLGLGAAYFASTARAQSSETPFQAFNLSTAANSSLVG